MTQVQYTVEPQGRPLAVMVSIATLEQLVVALQRMSSACELEGDKHRNGNKWHRLCDDADKALTKGRAALANAEPTWWQKIETAPKDGSFYLAFGEGKTWTQNQPNGCYPGEWHFSESRGEWRGHALTNDATHWMPLPHSPGDTL